MTVGKENLSQRQQEAAQRREPFARMMTENSNRKKLIIFSALLSVALNTPLVMAVSASSASSPSSATTPAANDSESQPAAESVSTSIPAGLASDLSASPAVRAAEVASQPEVEDKKTALPVSPVFAEKDAPNSTTSLLSMLLGLFFVIALIIVVAWGVRRFSTLHASGGRHIKVLSATAIGARERLALVEVGDKRILIGVTPQQINTLHVFAKEDISDERETSDFARKLQEIMKKGKVQ